MTILSALLEMSALSSYHHSVVEKNQDAMLDILRDIEGGMVYQSEASTFDYKRRAFIENNRYREVKKTRDGVSKVYSINRDDMFFFQGGISIDCFWTLITSLIGLGYLEIVDLPGESEYRRKFSLALSETGRTLLQTATYQADDFFVMTRAFINPMEKDLKPAMKSLGKTSNNLVDGKGRFGHSGIIYRVRNVDGYPVILGRVDNGEQTMVDGINAETSLYNQLYPLMERQDHSTVLGGDGYFTLHPSQIAEQAQTVSGLQTPEIAQSVRKTKQKLDSILVKLHVNKQEKDAIREQIKVLKASLEDSSDVISEIDALMLQGE